MKKIKLFGVKPDVYVKKEKKTLLGLLAIFFLAIVVRLWYFPGDIYFAYDQARDAFVSLKTLQGDLKIVGPPATFKGVNHGAMFYYIFGPVYWLFNGNPVGVAVLVRVINALGVFVVFAITKVLFNKKLSSYMAAVLFAISFEQTQYALFIGHPSLAVISVLLFYLGLALLIFRKRACGFAIAALGLGLSMQFHFSMINLFLVLVIMLLFFKKEILSPSRKVILVSLVMFLITVSTYVLAEMKFMFQLTRALVGFFFGRNESSAGLYFENTVEVLKRFVGHNLFFSYELIVFFGLATLLYFIGKKINIKKQIIFLSTWLVAGLLPYILGADAPTVYYYSIGGSISILILFSFVLGRIFSSGKLMPFGLLFFAAVVFSNLSLVSKHNKYGTIPEINVQDKMLLLDELNVIDYMYKSARAEDFSVNALTIPYNVNTTWSYLLEWYGEERYGYLPVWGGDAAAGFEGNISVHKAQSELPKLRYTIAEPRRGIPGNLTEEFFATESNFWDVQEERSFGSLTVQKRVWK